ncbi:hypothetical protein G3M48_004023 [Beauveria asiatica]|uniref:Uncharacterized protein n=1 Tax=Beauveria asiatica TaxID=1069075 RepID=A0AAW0RV90_9HYPO
MGMTETVLQWASSLPPAPKTALRFGQSMTRWVRPAYGNSTKGFDQPMTRLWQVWQVRPADDDCTAMGRLNTPCPYDCAAMGQLNTPAPKTSTSMGQPIPLPSDCAAMGQPNPFPFMTAPAHYLLVARP